MTAGELLAHMGTDGMRWAEEWCRIAREIVAADDGRELIDEGWMVGWFANAIEAGRDAGARRVLPEGEYQFDHAAPATDEWVPREHLDELLADGDADTA